MQNASAFNFSPRNGLFSSCCRHVAVHPREKRSFYAILEAFVLFLYRYSDFRKKSLKGPNLQKLPLQGK